MFENTVVPVKVKLFATHFPSRSDTFAFADNTAFPVLERLDKSKFARSLIEVSISLNLVFISSFLVVAFEFVSSIREFVFSIFEITSLKFAFTSSAFAFVFLVL